MKFIEIILIKKISIDCAFNRQEPFIQYKNKINMTPNK